ncbi:hypothetical protein, partial [Ruthenibacterium lactatiformans]|uniref:hypothetical protein n=1 Tax=Ruthenibacterium lactatiformans TaxID=1550024 RepID=UPI00195EB11F
KPQAYFLVQRRRVDIPLCVQQPRARRLRLRALQQLPVFVPKALVGLKSASISLRETARPVTGPTGAAILPFPSRLRRAGAPTAKPRRMDSCIAS